MMANLYALLRELRERHIYFELRSSREDYIMVYVDVPGERWEIEFPETGEVEVEVFRSDGEILGPEAVLDLFERHTDRA